MALCLVKLYWMRGTLHHVMIRGSVWGFNPVHDPERGFSTKIQMKQI